MKHYGSITVDKGKHLRSHFLAKHFKWCQMLPNAVQQCAATSWDTIVIDMFLTGLLYYAMLHNYAMLQLKANQSKHCFSGRNCE